MFTYEINIINYNELRPWYSYLTCSRLSQYRKVNSGLIGYQGRTGECGQLPSQNTPFKCFYYGCLIELQTPVLRLPCIIDIS